MMRESREANAPADVVAGPGHYTRLAIEPAEYIAQNNLGWLIGNIIKYASRAGHKIVGEETQAAAEIRDLNKVIRCAQMRINQLEGRHVAKDV